MSKRIFAFTAAAVLLFSLAGCVSVNFSVGEDRFIQGSGPMTTVEYPVGAYTAVDIRGEMELFYTAAQSDKVVIELQENLAEYMNVSVKDGVLTVTSDRRFQSDEGKSPKLYISAPTLEKLIVRGAVVVKEADPIKGDSFLLHVSGAATGDLPVEVNTLKVGANGATALTLSGSAGTADFQVSGAGTVDALELQTKQASVNITGTGDVKVACSDTLNIDISGMGSVDYKGDPKVTQSISGAGGVKRLD